MEYNPDIHKQLDSYSDLFDIYLEHGKTPEEYSYDPLSQYLQSQVEGYRSQTERDEDLRELVRERLLALFGEILPGVLEIQTAYKRELTMIEEFFNDSSEGRLNRWPELKRWLSYNFPKDVFNAEGYILRHLRKGLIGIGRQDYETRKKLRSILYKYPALDDILRQIGRERENDSEETDITSTVNIPILLRHSSSRQEIDGVTTGNNLAGLLPMEYAQMDEPVFYIKYVDRQLQQFHSKPPAESRQKTDRISTRKPRLEMGPVILAIDTSGSMSGKPLEISKALLTRIMYLARKQKRKCFLITFSVRAKYLEITSPGQYSKVEEFFSGRFTGGTDGEEMFAAALKALQKGCFAMADVLIISDFQFPLPKPETTKSILTEQAKGTRFYGLCIGRYIGGYSKVLDKFWKI